MVGAVDPEFEQAGVKLLSSNLLNLKYRFRIQIIGVRGQIFSNIYSSFFTGEH